MATSRTDIHCPSRIIPTDYTYVGIGTALRSGLGYHPFVIAEHNRIRAHMEQTGGTYASHEHGGSCMSCGAHATYLATFHHPKTNEYIRVGMDCAEKLGIGDVNRFRTFTKAVDAARHHLAGKRKALGLLQQRKLEGAYTLYLLLTDIPQATRGLGFTPETPLGILADFCEETGLEQGLVIRSLARQLDRGASLTREQGIVLDMVRKLVKYGSLSERQWSYLSSLLAGIEGKSSQNTINGGGVAEPYDRTAREEMPLPSSPPSPRTFSVQSRNGARSVTVSRTDEEALTICSRMTDNFAQDLSRQAPGGLSPRQWAWVHVLAEESEVNRRAEDARASQIEAIVTADTEQGMDKIIEMLSHAKEHLKRPRIRCVVQTPPDGQDSPQNTFYRLQIAERGAHPGWVNVTQEGGHFIGQISTDGLLHPREDLSGHPGLVDLLRRFAADPDQVAAEYGRLTGTCCYCGLELTDPRSTEVGYGQRCSEHYNRPWGKERRPQNHEEENPPRKGITLPPKTQSTPVPVQEVPSLPKISTRVLSYSHSDRTFSVYSSDLGLPDPFPRVIEVESARTGNVLAFRLSSRNYEGGELISVDYDSPDGELVLRIYND